MKKNKPNQKLAPDFYLIYDEKTKTITDGLFMSFKLEKGKDGYYCFKSIGPDGRTEFSMPIKEDLISEKLLGHYFIDYISKKTAEKILDVAFERFNFPAQERKITMRDLPVCMRKTPWLLYHDRILKPGLQYKSKIDDFDPKNLENVTDILLESIGDDTDALRLEKSKELQAKTPKIFDADIENEFIKCVADAFKDVCELFVEKVVNKPFEPYDGGKGGKGDK